MKKILHVTFNMDIGGTEQVIRQIIEGSASSFSHAVFCIDGRVGDIGKALKAQGITFFKYQRAPGFDFQLLRYLRKIIREQQFDVVHCHQYSPFSYAVMAAFGSPARVVFTEHGRFYPDSYSWKRRLLNPILNLMTESVVAISAATAEALAHYEWFPRGSVAIIYNGLQYSPAAQADIDAVRARYEVAGKTVLGTIARLDTIKNHGAMLDVFARVNASNPDTVLMIVGDGPEREKSQAQVVSLGIQDSVIFTGFQTDPDPYFELIDIFLLPSFSEGTSMTLLQSMAAARPSVVSDVGGNPEIVKHGETGYVFAVDDLDEFERSIELLLDSEHRAAMGQRARKRYVENYTVEEMVDSYQRIYCQ